jgi:hypothetical protein
MCIRAVFTARGRAKGGVGGGGGGEDRSWELLSLCELA